MVNGENNSTLVGLIDPAEGCIRRIFDKQQGVDVVTRACGLNVIEDKGDTWGHNITTWDTIIGRFGQGESKLINQGALSATLAVNSHYETSRCELLVTLYRDLDTIDVNVHLNWQGRSQMVKLAFETNVGGGEAWYETAYGATWRPADAKEVPAQQWMDMSGKIDP